MVAAVTWKKGLAGLVPGLVQFLPWRPSPLPGTASFYDPLQMASTKGDPAGRPALTGDMRSYCSLDFQEVS